MFRFTGFYQQEQKNSAMLPRDENADNRGRKLFIYELENGGDNVTNTEQNA
jgi:hypothetical protein